MPTAKSQQLLFKNKPNFTATPNTLASRRAGVQFTIQPRQLPNLSPPPDNTSNNKKLNQTVAASCAFHRHKYLDPSMTRSTKGRRMLASAVSLFLIKSLCPRVRSPDNPSELCARSSPHRRHGPPQHPPPNPHSPQDH